VGDPAPRQSGVEQISRIRPSLPYAQTALIALLVCAGYYVGAELAFILRIPSTHSSIIWAPNAVLLAVLLLTPPRTWAIWFLAALPAHLVAQSRDGGSVVVLLYPFFANVVQVIVAAMGLRCFAAAPPRFNILRDTALFVLIAAITAPAMISFLAAWLFVSAGWETDFWLVSRGRFLNNITTGLTVTPLILMAAESGLAGLRRRWAQRYIEFALLAVGLGGTLYLTHTWTTVGAGRIPFQLHAPLPFLLWAAVRFGPGGLCLFLLFVAAHSISETISGRGPYIAQTPAENVLTLQISLAVLAIPLMFVAALIGERRKKEEALREIEDRLKRMADSIPEVIWITDIEPAERVVYTSPSFERVWGLRLADLYQNPRLWMETIHPEDRARIGRIFSKWIAGADVGYQDVEFRIVQPNGAIRWIHTRGVPTVNAQGRPIRFSGISTDITERKRAEQRLLVQHSVTQLLANAATLEEATPKILQAMCECLVWDLGELWRIDRAAGVLRCVEVWHKESIKAPQFVAASRDRTFMPGTGLPGRVWSSREPAYIPDVVQDSNFPRASIAAREGLHAAFGFPILLGNEVLGVMGFFSQEIRQPDQDLLDMMATIGSQIGQFIERKRAEETIQQDERELRQLIDFVPQHILVARSDGTLLDANQGTLEYHGMTLQEVQAEDFYTKILHPDDLSRVLDERQGGISAESSWETEARLLRKDGQYRWFLIRSNPLRNEQGSIIRRYITATDIEGRKQAEERVQRENIALREEVDKASMFEEIVGSSNALRKVLLQIAKVAPTDSTVVLIGETGTGKELIARAIHKRSRRSSRAFVSINCSAIPQPLIASELFGHEKGAFTGALQQRLGRFELAEGGTIFLDEIGDFPSDTQNTLLRVLQEHEFERVGGTQTIRADVRVIAATNCDLMSARTAGTFRSDLFYRLNVFPIETPSLRERKEDIPMLVEYFIDRYASKAGKDIKSINKKSLELLQRYSWPGNIRELQNVIERSVVVCETETLVIDENWLPRNAVKTPPLSRPLSEELRTQEKERIEAALTESRGRISGASGAAAKLGFPPSTLDSKIRSLKINRHRFKTV
jgi:PAS domain S-box-containing protein